MLVVGRFSLALYNINASVHKMYIKIIINFKCIHFSITVFTI